jgi:hypothetical protein
MNAEMVWRMRINEFRSAANLNNRRGGVNLINTEDRSAHPRPRISASWLALTGPDLDFVLRASQPSASIARGQLAVSRRPIQRLIGLSAAREWR